MRERRNESSAGSPTRSHEFSRNVLLGSSGLSSPALEALGARRTFTAGETVDISTPESLVLFPESCVVTIEVMMRDGTSAEVSTAGREGLVGFSSGAPNIANLSARVDIPGSAVMLPGSAMQRLLRTDSFRQGILEHFEHQSLLTARLAACNRLHHLNQRLARWILLTSDRVGRESFPMTQERLAGIIGVRRPGVTLAASDFMRKGLIHYVRGTMEVTDRQGLRRESCECYEDIRSLYRLR